MGDPQHRWFRIPSRRSENPVRPGRDDARGIAATPSPHQSVRSARSGLRLEVRDAKGQPSVWDGIASFVTEQDGAGNTTRVSNLDPDGKLVRDAAAPWSLIEMKRNEHGELTQRTYFKADADGSLKQIRS